MCLATVLSPLADMGTDIDKGVLEHAWESNPDGGGFAYVRGDKVRIKKGYMTLKKFTKALYATRKANPDSYFLVHMRWASKGKVNVENTHPFWVREDKMAMIHNGTIYKAKPKGDESDTLAFTRDILQALPENFFEQEVYSSLLEEYIGSSKVAILRNDNSVLILNESKGDIVDNGLVWHSNDYYKPTVTRDSTTNKRVEEKEYTYKEYCYDSYPSKDDLDAVQTNLLDFKSDKPKGTTKAVADYGSCEWCGYTLSSQYEKECGICTWCIQYCDESGLTYKDIARNEMGKIVCEECGVTLIGETYKDLGYCKKCFEKTLEETKEA
jgi:predicted glutamine amidotransferase